MISVVKIFGIYTRAQLDKDKRFWNSIGYQLSQKGEEYRHRCTFREEPYHKGDGAIPPAEFNLRDVEEEVHDSKTIPVLPKEDLEEVRRFQNVPVLFDRLNLVDSLTTRVSLKMPPKEEC